MGLREAIQKIKEFETSVRPCGTGACVRVPRAWMGEIVVVRVGSKEVRRALPASCGNSAHVSVPKRLVHGRASARRTDLMSGVRKFSEKLKTAYPGTRVWLYGSQLNGRPRRWSDVDLLVVMGRGLRRISDSTGLVERFWPLRQPPDVLCYTRERFEREKGLCAIVDEVRRTGVRV